MVVSSLSATKFSPVALVSVVVVVAAVVIVVAAMVVAVVVQGSLQRS